MWLFNFSALQLQHRLTAFWVFSTKEEVTRQVSETGNSGVFGAVLTKETIVFVVYSKSLNILCLHMFRFTWRGPLVCQEKGLTFHSISTVARSENSQMGLLEGSDGFGHLVYRICWMFGILWGWPMKNIPLVPQQSGDTGYKEWNYTCAWECTIVRHRDGFTVQHRISLLDTVTSP